MANPMQKVNNPVDIQNRLARLDPKVFDTKLTSEQKRQLHRLKIAIETARHEADLLNDLLEE